MAAQPSLLAGRAGAAAGPDTDIAARPHQLRGLLRRPGGCKTPMGPWPWGLGTLGAPWFSSGDAWIGKTTRGSPLELWEFLGNTPSLGWDCWCVPSQNPCDPFPLGRFHDSRIFLLQNSPWESPLGCRNPHSKNKLLIPTNFPGHSNLFIVPQLLRKVINSELTTYIPAATWIKPHLLGTEASSLSFP